MKPFYISTTIPYVNGDPHIGHALEYVQADAVARFRRLLGDDVFFLSGTDENSLKNVQAAEKAGMETADFVAEKAKGFYNLKESLDISFDDFIRTTEDRHKAGAQKLWTLCEKDIYKKTYKGLYCVGCESFYKEEELVDGVCPEHKKAPEVVEEENYFFKLSSYQKQIEEIFEKDIIKFLPEYRKNEMYAFIKRGLEDFSVSRSQERAHGWGVTVPGDDSQIMYVWFDALSNYINALGFGGNEELYKKYWLQKGERQVVHTLGKGVARFHLVYWVGMLLSAGIPLPTEQFIHGYITVEGEKMSKSIGNVLNPHELAKELGSDPLRYFMLGAISPGQDGDFSRDRFEDVYAADLANGIGNLTSRVLTMIEKYADGSVPAIADDPFDVETFWSEYDASFKRYEFDRVVQRVQSLVSACDGLISEQKPWEKAKQGEGISELLYQCAEALRHIALALLPIIPETAEKMLEQLGVEEKTLPAKWGGLKESATIKKADPLFPRRN